MMKVSVAERRGLRLAESLTVALPEYDRLCGMPGGGFGTAVAVIGDIIGGGALGYDLFGKKPKAPKPAPITTIPGSSLETVVGGTGGGAPLLGGKPGASQVLAQALGTNPSGAVAPPSSVTGHGGGGAGAGAAPPVGSAADSVGSNLLPWLNSTGQPGIAGNV